MKAIVATGNGKSTMTEVSKPEPGPKEIVARVKYSGICATDIAIITGKTSFVKRGWLNYPVRVGHEWSGIIESVGSEVRNLKVGDRVVSETSWSCYDCPECWQGKHCINGRALGTVGNHWPGCHADYMLMPCQSVYKLDDSMTLKNACLFEPAAIAMDGIVKLNVKAGDTVLVTGTGPIGLTGVGLLKAMGIRVFVSGRRDSKLEYARKMGADILINVKNTSIKQVLDENTPYGTVDGILEASGNQEVVPELNDYISGGRIAMAGFFEKDFKDFDLDSLLLKGNSIMGVCGGTGILPQMIKLIRNSHVDFTPLISGVYSFNDALTAIDKVIENDGNRMKVMLDHEDVDAE